MTSSDGVNGVGMDVADVPTMISTLESLLADPDRRAAIAGRARDHVVARFGRQRFAAALGDALSRVTPVGVASVARAQ